MKDQNMTRTHAGAWNMTAGGLVVLMTVLLWGATVNPTSNGWLLLPALAAGAGALIAKVNADRDLNLLLDATTAAANRTTGSQQVGA